MSDEAMRMLSDSELMRPRAGVVSTVNQLNLELSFNLRPTGRLLVLLTSANRTIDAKQP